MKKMIVIVLGVALSHAAMAGPSIRASAAGSSILFHVSNPDEREYGCSITWTVSWTNYGSPGGNTLNRNVVVRAKQEGLLMQDNTTYSNLKLESYSANCT